jgi:hypothetical protein
MMEKEQVQMASIGTGIGSSSVMQSQTFLSIEKSVHKGKKSTSVRSGSKQNSRPIQLTTKDKGDRNLNVNKRLNSLRPPSQAMVRKSVLPSLPNPLKNNKCSPM